MKRFVFILACFLLFACATGEIKTRTDEYTGIQFIEGEKTIIPRHSPGNFRLWLRQAYSKNKTAATTMLILDYRGKIWYFFDRIDFLIDGKQLNLNTDTHKHDVHDGYVTEWVVFKISFAEVSEIETATTVKMRARGSKGSFEYVFTKDDFAFFAHFVKAVSK